MRGKMFIKLIKLSVSLVIVLGTLILTRAGSAQQDGSKAADKKDQTPPPIYNPYPPGILPPDLEPEIARVRREVNSIFNQALAESRALPPTQPGQGPTYQAVRALGKLMNFDEHMSVEQNMACASCHMPYVGFSGPIPSVNLTMTAYPGTFRFRAGKRTAQRYTYSPRFPVLNFN